MNTATPFALLPSTIIGDYSLPESDLAFDHSADSPWPLKAIVTSPPSAPFFFSLVDVSRASGQRLNPRAVPNFADGLAYDGFNRLWAKSAGALYAVNVAGGWSFHMWVPAGITDLASTPCRGSNAPRADLGDAPDSTNHYAVGMTAYGGVQASFPVVYDMSTGFPQGPRHHAPRQYSWLGDDVSAEADADMLYDEDVITNIDPPADAPDRDGADDGVLFPIHLPQCQMTAMSYRLRAGGQIDHYSNVWFDYNRNGQWGDQIQCMYQGQPYTVNEWAVQNQMTNLGAGLHVVSTPQFRSLDVDSDIWMRISVAEAPAPASDGRGVQFGYETGETEDYLVVNTQGDEYGP